MTSRAERLRGGLLGLLVGDALGVPYEFHDAGDLPDAIEMEPPPTFRRAHAGIAPGTWSDDGAQALALLASLLQHDGRLDVDDFGRRLVNWYEHGYMAVDDHVFDVGVQTGLALRLIRAGTPAALAGPDEESRNGNGSLMRVLPVALVHRGTDAELAAAADLSSRPTHGHARSRVACALYALWARRILDEDPEPWRSATAAMRALVTRGSPEHDALEAHLRPDEGPTGHGSGYVVDTLASARMCVARHARFEDAVVAAVRLGDDTDTTAAVTGGVAGLREGEGAIPTRWRTALRGEELVAPLLDALVRRG